MLLEWSDDSSFKLLYYPGTFAVALKHAWEDQVHWGDFWFTKQLSSMAIVICNISYPHKVAQTILYMWYTHARVLWYAKCHVVYTRVAVVMFAHS